jgi:hypothetical protein
MRRAQARLYAGSTDTTTLRTLATDRALAAINVSLFQYEQAGVVFRGAPVSTYRVTALDLRKHPATATVTECLDTSAWQAIYRATGESAARPGQVRRYTVTHTVQRFGTAQRWMDVNFTVDKDRPC